MHVHFCVYIGGPHADKVLVCTTRHRPRFRDDLGILSPGYVPDDEPAFWLVPEDTQFHVFRTLRVIKEESEYVCCLYY